MNKSVEKRVKIKGKKKVSFQEIDPNIERPVLFVKDHVEIYDIDDLYSHIFNNTEDFLNNRWDKDYFKDTINYLKDNQETGQIKGSYANITAHEKFRSIVKFIIDMIREIDRDDD